MHSSSLAFRLDGQVLRAVTDSPEDSGRRPKRRQVTTACNACRTRKHKCSGDRPECTGCQDRGSECVYEAEPNSTRASTLKRAHNGLVEEVAVLRDLLHALRERPRRHVHVLLTLLRAGETPQTALRHVADLEPTPPPSHPGTARWHAFAPADSELDTWLKTHYSALYPAHSNSAAPRTGGDPMRIQNIVTDGGTTSRAGRASDEIASRALLSASRPLADERLSRLDLDLWPSVPLSSPDAARLISIYLSWLHPWFTLFDQDLFLDHLLSGSTEACSSLLLLAICACAATLHSSLDPDRCVPLREQLLSQALTLWWDQIYYSSHQVTTVSAAVILAFDVLYNGDEALALRILHEGYEIARALGMFAAAAAVPSPKTPPRASREDIDPAISVAEWGFYTATTHHISQYYALPICKCPPSLPRIEQPVTRFWQRWPVPGAPQGEDSNRTTRTRDRAVIQLSRFVHEHCTRRLDFRLFDIKHDARGNHAFRLSAMLVLDEMQHWAARLPEDLRLHDESPPFVIDMHITTHSLIMQCLRPVLHADEHARYLFSSSLRQATHLIRQSHALWGSYPNFVNTLGPLTNVSFSLLQSAGINQEADDALVECLTILHDLARYLPIFGDVLRALFVIAEKRGVVLPSAALDVQRRVELLAGKRPAPTELAGLSMIVDFDLAVDDPDAATVKAVLLAANTREGAAE